MLGLVALLVFLSVDYRMLAEHSLMHLRRLSRLLVYVLFKGSTQMRRAALDRDRVRSTCSRPSSREWASRSCSRCTSARTAAAPRNTGDLVIGGVFTAVRLLLIAKQPDLGTAVTLMPVFFGIAYLAGLRMRLLPCSRSWRVLLAPIVWKFALKDYQKVAHQTFIDPEQDPQGRRLPARSRRGSPSDPAA